MRLLEHFGAVARQRRLADNTIEAYRSWVQQFLRFSANAHGGWKRPEELGTADVEALLNDLVSRRRLSASSQNQALNALVFLYGQVLDAIPENHQRPHRDAPGLIAAAADRTGRRTRKPHRWSRW